MSEHDRRIAEIIAGERVRLRAFISRMVANEADVEDLLQEVFYEVVAAHWVMEPVQRWGAWMLRVARNRVIDRFRTRRVEVSASDPLAVGEDGEDLFLGDVLPSPDAGPETAYVRAVLVRELEDALAELPAEQREVFIAHELEGVSFKELAARAGVGINTLLSRKRYAVLHLRRRLRAIHDEIVGIGE